MSIVVDGRFVPAPIADIATVDAGDEAVLLEQSTARFHMLSAAAALVWERVDGVTSLAELAFEISGATDAPVERVLPDIVVLVRGLAEEGLVVPAPAPEPGGDDPDVSADRRAWIDERFEPAAASLTISVGGRRARVRASAAGALDDLLPVIDPMVVGHDPDAPAVSILVGDSGRVGRSFDRVFSENIEITSGPPGARLLWSVLAQLGDLLAEPNDALRLDAAALIDPRGRAVIVDDRSSMRSVGRRRLQRLGLSWVEMVSPAIDRTTLQLVVPDLLAPFDRGRVEAALPLGVADDPLPPGRHDVTRFVSLASRPDHLKVTSPARRLGSLVPLVRTNDGRARGSDLAAVGVLAERVGVERALGLTIEDVVEVLQPLGYS